MLRQAIRPFAALGVCTLLTIVSATVAGAQTQGDIELQRAQRVIREFTTAGGNSIPAELIENARGIAVIGNVIRGGLIVGARRGRGVLSVRMDDGSWSNPAFIALTGGSIGWQFGADSTDVVLIFANDNSVRNISSGKFTLGGEATAVAGPLRKHASSQVTFRAEVYGYQISRGLFAGAAFQGARLRIDADKGASFYSGLPGAEPLGYVTGATPIEARRFLDALRQASLAPTPDIQKAAPLSEPAEAARTFPLPD